MADHTRLLVFWFANFFNMLRHKDKNEPEQQPCGKCYHNQFEDDIKRIVQKKNRCQQIATNYIICACGGLELNYHLAFRQLCTRKVIIQYFVVAHSFGCHARSTPLTQSDAVT